ncbi:hypothetical protein [Paenarthrobacter ureafaciens]|uniref:hypothetical protein n=1 Tax=Paenarthrobacter ureafaciens TaxID=37931 RepID=UPI001C2CB305|nr:hypothetical protein [Paenarthrobacter ureafaciens]
MNRISSTAVAILSMAMLSACSTPSPQAAPEVSVEPAATASPTLTPTPTVSRNENARGQLIKEIGEPAGLLTSGENTPPTMTFKVTSIKPIECDAPYATPPTGTALAISIEATTTPQFSGPLIVNSEKGLVSFGPHYWKGYAANGTRMNTVESSATQNCLADKTRLLPDYIGKGEQVNGLIILDVSSPSGEVSFDPSGFGGWVWKYPS